MDPESSKALSQAKGDLEKEKAKNKNLQEQLNHFSDDYNNAVKEQN